MACWAVVMRARVGSPRFVPKLETRTSSAMPVALRDVVAQVLRSCVRFVASLLLRCRGRFSRLLRALPHEAGFFPRKLSNTAVLIVATAQQLHACGWLVKLIHLSYGYS